MQAGGGGRLRFLKTRSLEIFRRRDHARPKTTSTFSFFFEAVWVPAMNEA